MHREIGGLNDHYQLAVRRRHPKVWQVIDAYFAELSVAIPLQWAAANDDESFVEIGAGEEDRTLDIHLGKVALYR